MSGIETARSYDLIVLGSGAGGLAAAVTAAHQGLRVLMLEKEAHFGGASAISGGTIWVPGNEQAVAAGLDSSTTTARTYLRNIIGDGANTELVDAFLERGPEALAFLEKSTELKFKVRPFSPDYHMEIAGSSDGGRALEVLEYDGSNLGERFRELRKPPEGMLLFGGMMVNRVDVQHFLNMRRSLASFMHCMKLIARYAKDRLSYDRGTRLVVGNALVARLVRSAFDLGVELKTKIRTARLIEENGAICGVVLEDGQEIRSTCGVVLATGGFGASSVAERWRDHTDRSHRSMSPAGNVGDGIELASVVGGVVGDDLVSNFYWAPVSVRVHADGREELFPHLVTDRAKPGIIAVNKLGRRFVNEADSYHRFVMAMQANQAANSPCFLICDQTALSAYGMGLARPAPVSNLELIQSGYLVEADTVSGLAAKIGVDADALSATVENFNASAVKGADPEFNRGATSYNVSMGDPDHKPNACLAPLEKGPFYAIRIFTGDLGSARGLRTDASARVLDGENVPIAGLYAVGNDMNSMMNGTYPGPGITLGPALTFGYLAALDAAKKTTRN